METHGDNKFDYMHTYAKYFGLTVQMILIILLGGFGGKALDNYFHTGSSVLTVILIILAAILSFYLLFKTLLHK